eukprot:scaffold179_cov368-Prasinococcus_capsulatus_cf.AAC.21
MRWLGACNPPGSAVMDVRPLAIGLWLEHDPTAYASPSRRPPLWPLDRWGQFDRSVGQIWPRLWRGGPSVHMASADCRGRTGYPPISEALHNKLHEHTHPIVWPTSARRWDALGMSFPRLHECADQLPSRLTSVDLRKLPEALIWKDASMQRTLRRTPTRL